jgi:chromosome segregation ATPase
LFKYSVPILVSGYFGFLWSGYGLGKWAQQGETAALKATIESSKAQNETAKAQNESLRTINEVLKEKMGVFEERLKLASDQAEKAKKEAEELKAEVEKLERRLEADATEAYKDFEKRSEELKTMIFSLNARAASVSSANTAISTTLEPPWEAASLRSSHRSRTSPFSGSRGRPAAVSSRSTSKRILHPAELFAHLKAIQRNVSGVLPDFGRYQDIGHGLGSGAEWAGRRSDPDRAAQLGP